MSQPTPELDVVAAFRRRLAELPEPGRRGGPALAAGAATVLVGVPLVAGLAASGGTSDALAITRDAGMLELRIADASADAEQLTRELVDAGIRGRVLTVPVTAAQSGRWVVTAEIAGRRVACRPPRGSAPVAETVRLSEIENAGDVLRIPVARVRESSGSFALVAGRPARAGEQPVDVASPQAAHDLLAPLVGPLPARLPDC